MKLLPSAGLAATLLSVCFAPVLTAQDSTTKDPTTQGQRTGVLPAGPALSMHIDGPAALRAAFLPTNLGRMFAGPEFKEMLAPVMKMMESMKERAGGQLPFNPDDFQAAVLNYRGRISMGMYLLDETLNLNGAPPRFSVVITMSPDGKTDLKSFCSKAQAMMKERLGEALRDLTMGETTVPYMLDDSSGDPGFSSPFMFKNHAAIVISPDMKGAVKHLGTVDAPTLTTSSEHGAASIGFQLHTKRIFAMIAAGMKDQMGDMWDATGVHVFNGLGLPSLDAVELSVRAKGPAVVQEVSFAFNDKDRGMMKAFLNPQNERSQLIPMLPRTAMSALACKFDWKEVYGAVKTMFTNMGDNAPESFSEIEESFKEEFGIRLNEDLVALFTGGAMSVQMESDGGGNPMLGPVDGATFGFAVSDTEKLAKTVDTILRKNGLHAGRKREEYKSFNVYKMNVAGVADVHYAVAAGMLLVGVGDGAGVAIRATLDTAKMREQGTEIAAFSTDIKNRLGMFTGGYSGFGWSNSEAAMESASAQLDAMAGQLPPEFDMFAEMIEKMPGMMKTYKLRYQVSLIRESAKRWTYTSIW